MAAFVPLQEARDASRFGGKAVQLGEGLRAGLPVPAGVALATEVVDDVARGDVPAVRGVEALLGSLGGRVAVRSSAVGEDGATASFAGIHVSILNVMSTTALVAAIGQVRASAHGDAAMQYRRRRGIEGVPRIGVVVQAMIDADRAGVMFTRCPVSGRDERVIEAAWGLGEAIVAGAVTPDYYRLDRSGAVLETRAGLKDRMIVFDRASGETREADVEPARHRTLCLTRECLRRLHALADACDHAFGTHAPHDIEWAFTGSRIHLLQRRPVTASTGAKP